MRALIYNQWVATLGGGEQTLGAFALTLADHYDVDIITHEEPDWRRFREILGFDLGAIGTRVVPYDPVHYRGVSEATRDYDLFVNCSYLDHVRAYAARNVMQVFFPPAPPTTAGAVRPAPPLPRPHAEPRLEAIGGLYPLERDGDRVFAWTDGRARFRLLDPGSGPVLVTFALSGHRPATAPSSSITVTVDGVAIGETVPLSRTGYESVRFTIPAELASGRTPFVELHSDTYEPGAHREDPRPELGVRVASAVASHAPDRPVDELPEMAWPSCWGPFGLERWTDHHRFYDAVATYDLLLANSHFTQRWIALRLGRASELLYPPVQVDHFVRRTKQRRIISVGRFFVEGHSKKQLHMIELFKQLCDRGLEGWEYHLVGGTRHDPGAVRYLERCREAAVGYPICFHADAPLSELIDLYSESTLYWNATGYGEDPDVEPDRFEHFGMTTVEAMAAGCVPLSYNRAGQPEVIEPEWSGVLFETLDELGDATMRLVEDPERTRVMADAAVERSATFSYDRFRSGLLRLLAGDAALAGPVGATTGREPA